MAELRLGGVFGLCHLARPRGSRGSYFRRRGINRRSIRLLGQNQNFKNCSLSMVAVHLTVTPQRILGGNCPAI